MQSLVLPYHARHPAVTGMFVVRTAAAVSYRRSHCRCFGVGRSCQDTTGQSPGVHSCYCAHSGRKSVGQNFRWVIGRGCVIQSQCYSCPWWCQCYQTVNHCANGVCLNAECLLGCLLQTLFSCLLTYSHDITWQHGSKWDDGTSWKAHFFSEKRHSGMLCRQFSDM